MSIYMNLHHSNMHIILHIKWWRKWALTNSKLTSGWRGVVVDEGEYGVGYGGVVIVVIREMINTDGMLCFCGFGMLYFLDFLALLWTL